MFQNIIVHNLCKTTSCPLWESDPGELKPATLSIERWFLTKFDICAKLTNSWIIFRIFASEISCIRHSVQYFAIGFLRKYISKMFLSEYFTFPFSCWKNFQILKVKVQKKKQEECMSGYTLLVRISIFRSNHSSLTGFELLNFLIHWFFFQNTDIGEERKRDFFRGKSYVLLSTIKLIVLIFKRCTSRLSALNYV